MFCKLNAMQFVAFFILANTITLCLGRHVFSAEENKLSERVTRNGNDEMKEVYKTHFLPAPFKYIKPFRKQPNYNEATDRIEKEKQYYSDLNNAKNNLRNNYQAFKHRGGNNGQLSFNEFLALKLYTGPDYEIINYFLRSGKMPGINNLSAKGKDVFAKWTPQAIEKVVNDIKSGLKKLEKEENKKLYRGTTLDAEVFSNGKKVTIKSLKQGDVFNERGFVSTTVDRREAEKIAQQLSKDFKSKPVILVLSKNPKSHGFRAANIEGLSKNKNEEERLLLPGVEFQVLSKKEEKILINSGSVTMTIIEVTKF